MGHFASKNKDNTFIEQLEKVERQIRSIEEYSRNTKQLQNKVVTHFLVLSIGVYIISVLLFYFYLNPTDWKERLLYLLPLVIAPILIFMSKKGITVFYSGKLKKNQRKLVLLREQKKKIIEEVMQTETYLVAQSILEKYSSHTLTKRFTSPRRSGSKFPSTSFNLREGEEGTCVYLEHTDKYDPADIPAAVPVPCK